MSALGLSLVTLGAGTNALAQPTTGIAPGNYVVVLTTPPAATYTGTEPGFAATAPSRGGSFQATAPAAQAYRAHLESQQRDLATEVGADVGYQYTVALNGFSARLSAEQAAQLADRPEVRAVIEDTARHVDTVKSPEFLGLDGNDGVWNKLGGPDDAGAGVVVGVLDTGIWPGSPSFAGAELPIASPGTTPQIGQPYRTSGTGTAMVKADGDLFTGECQAGEEWTPADCNDKLISARYYADTFLAQVPPEHRGEFEKISAYDGDGHGTHTAGTAAGNHGVDMSVAGNDYGEGSGMAPAAKIAVYKICWQDDDETTGGCYASDAVAAIDQAIIDGVDVINFSIGGALDTAVDPVELAFLSAASANIFVAASAGNEGAGASTVAHNSPWLTTIAASTHARREGTVELGDGQLFRGAMISPKGVEEQTPLVYAGDVAAGGADPVEAARCTAGTLDRAAIQGTIVLCDRGVSARVDKSAEVARVGGVGMILGNVSPDEDTTGDVHAVPTTHVAAADSAAIRDYIGSASEGKDPTTPRDDPTTPRHSPSPPGDDLTTPGGRATAALLPGDHTELPPTPTPVVAGFSSRGPALANGGDLLKPDIAAPGVDVLAAVVPGPHGDDQFTFHSGTSMSSPHIAGLAALVFGEKPGWSPMAVKSAMMTTAYNLATPDGSADTDHFAGGAGQVDPTRFLTPGLLYESTPADWLSFLEGTGESLGIPGAEPIDPSDLNQPSIAVGSLPGRQRVIRKVTADTPGLYQAIVEVPGFAATVRPSVLHFSQLGQVKEFTVTLTRTDAELGVYTHGSLTWHGGGTTVRSPIVVRPVALAAPAEVNGTGASGEIRYEVTAATTGDIDVKVQGVVPGRLTEGNLVPGQPLDPEGNASSVVVPVDIPEGTPLARFDLRSGAADADYDLYVYGPDGEQVPVNGATSEPSEQVDLADPEPGTYTVLVHLYSGVNGAPVDFDLTTFVVGSAASGNLDVSPNPIPGVEFRPAELTLTYSGLKENVRHLGLVTYEGSELSTIVSIE